MSIRVSVVFSLRTFEGREGQTKDAASKRNKEKDGN